VGINYSATEENSILNPLMDDQEDHFKAQSTLSQV